MYVTHINITSPLIMCYILDYNKLNLFNITLQRWFTYSSQQKKGFIIAKSSVNVRLTD